MNRRRKISDEIFSRRIVHGSPSYAFHWLILISAFDFAKALNSSAAGKERTSSISVLEMTVCDLNKELRTLLASSS
jgi:hypothetical protein